MRVHDARRSTLDGTSSAKDTNKVGIHYINAHKKCMEPNGTMQKPDRTMTRTEHRYLYFKIQVHTTGVPYINNSQCPTLKLKASRSSLADIGTLVLRYN